MKSLSFSAVLLFSLLFSNFSFAQQSLKKENLKVWGNCGMCKKTIENAAKSAGATAANWNEESKQLKVSYAANKTSGEKIQQAIAAKGYDTKDFTGNEEAYKNLHSCCQYERKETATTAEVKACCEKKECKKDAAHCSGMQCSKDKSANCKTAGCCKM